MLYSLCFMLYALCFMLYTLCFMLYALCFSGSHTMNKQDDQNNGVMKYARLFALLMRMRQSCCHPFLVLGKGSKKITPVVPSRLFGENSKEEKENSGKVAAIFGKKSNFSNKSKKLKILSRYDIVFICLIISFCYFTNSLIFIFVFSNFYFSFLRFFFIY